MQDEVVFGREGDERLLRIPSLLTPGIPLTAITLKTAADKPSQRLCVSMDRLPGLMTRGFVVEHSLACYGSGRRSAFRWIQNAMYCRNLKSRNQAAFSGFVEANKWLEDFRVEALEGKSYDWQIAMNAALDLLPLAPAFLLKTGGRRLTQGISVPMSDEDWHNTMKIRAGSPGSVSLSKNVVTRRGNPGRPGDHPLAAINFVEEWVEEHGRQPGISSTCSTEREAGRLLSRLRGSWAAKTLPADDASGVKTRFDKLMFDTRRNRPRTETMDSLVEEVVTFLSRHSNLKAGVPGQELAMRLRSQLIRWDGKIFADRLLAAGMDGKVLQELLMGPGQKRHRKQKTLLEHSLNTEEREWSVRLKQMTEFRHTQRGEFDKRGLQDTDPVLSSWHDRMLVKYDDLSPERQEALMSLGVVLPEQPSSMRMR